MMCAVAAYVYVHACRYCHVRMYISTDARCCRVETETPAQLCSPRYTIDLPAMYNVTSAEDILFDQQAQ